MVNDDIRKRAPYASKLHDLIEADAPHSEISRCRLEAVQHYSNEFGKHLQGINSAEMCFVLAAIEFYVDGIKKSVPGLGAAVAFTKVGLGANIYTMQVPRGPRKSGDGKEAPK